MSNTDNGYQALITKNITAISETVDLTSPNQATEIIQLSGTWVGTFVVEGSNDGITFYPLLDLLSSGIPTSTITSNGAYSANTNGFAIVRLRSSAWTAGTATVNVWGSDATSISTNIDLLRGATDGTLIGNNGNKLLVDGSKVTQPVTQSGDWVNKLTDGTNTAEISNNGELEVVDGLRNGGTYGSLALTTANTAYEVKVGVSRLANRKSLTITAMDDMYWGYDNAVTISTGTPLYKNQQIIFAIDPNSTFQIWVVAGSNSKSARITESA